MPSFETPSRFEATLQSPSNLYKLSKGLIALAKVSDDITFQASSGILTLSCLDSRKSTFALLRLHTSTFFDSYTYASDETAFSFAVSSKLLSAIFKQYSVIVQCDLIVDEGSIHDPTKLVLVIHQSSGIVIKFAINYEFKDAVHALCRKTDCTNSFSLSASSLKRCLDHAASSVDEVAFTFSSPRIEVAFTTLKAASIKNQSHQNIRTFVYLKKEEFDEIEVTADDSVSVSLKDFRNFATLADSLKVAVNAYFHKPSFPLMLEIELPQSGFSAVFVLVSSSHSVDSASKQDQRQPRPASAQPSLNYGNNVRNPMHMSAQLATARNSHTSFATSPSNSQASEQSNPRPRQESVRWDQNSAVRNISEFSSTDLDFNLDDEFFDNLVAAPGGSTNEASATQRVEEPKGLFDDNSDNDE
ncbi:hypothetical protein CANCADRAFT_134704 [Tortispora caseinolytica NRRL Y-17796]|uniref:DNA repair protein rad9 n=1 Tax=Tortispora caseinolytica NRRL Y-17796 TaxID=767744 RepID=A0A1E4TBT1_9ASCO|nr:hypothetical protein CANCADRAFT_134704 [Tortispora caseinolytica NRRL Y-17796]